MPSPCAVARSFSPATGAKTPTRLLTSWAVILKRRATSSTLSTRRGFPRRFSQVRSIRILCTGLSILSRPRLCGRCFIKTLAHSANTVAFGLWRWPPRSASKKGSPKSRSRARPSGQRLRAWECAGSGPNAGSLPQILSMREKRRRERLMRMAAEHPDSWAVGFCDESWWSRSALPSLHSWSEKGEPLRLLQQSVAKDDPDPKAISCYGLYVPEFEEVLVRFVDGRPVSGITTRFLSWCSEKLEAAGKRVWVLIWDNASWHISKEVREWIASHNREAKNRGQGVRIISCLLPKKSPWLNSMEPKWVHGKRKVVEPDGLLTAHELAERVCLVFDCAHYEHLSIAENAA